MGRDAREGGDPRRAHRLNISLPIPCPACRYDLRGLTSAEGAKCPECGGEFTHAQIVAARRKVSRAFLWKLLLTPVLMAAAAIVTVPFAPGASVPIVGAVAAFGAGFLWVLIAERRARILTAGPTPREEALVSVCAVLMAFTLTTMGAVIALPVAVAVFAAIEYIRYAI